MLLTDERKEIVSFGEKMLAANLTHSSGGNLSIINRNKRLIAITPSGIEYTDMKPKDILVIDLDGNVVEGSLTPSSETGFHLALYLKRNDINSVIHTHSVFATTYACLNREIKPVHYLIGFAGNKVPVAPYATYGTKELAENIISSLSDFNAVLLANHGLVSVGKNVLSAFNVAQEIEFVAQVSYQCENIGIPKILSNKEMAKVIKKFSNYGSANIK
jgi:L-fuculose-phosphate aldolase